MLFGTDKAIGWPGAMKQHLFERGTRLLDYLRIPTWAPFRLQACCNGHDWLERRLKAKAIRFTKADNCFTPLSRNCPGG